MSAGRRSNNGNRVLIISQNMPVPQDKRVWLEANALSENGYTVSIICPLGSAQAKREVVNGIHLFRYSPPPQAMGPFGYIFEFFYCWVRTFFLSLKVVSKPGFDIIHACNPPDTIFLIAKLYKLFGKRFVFDQHDLSPELYLSRFNKTNTFLLRALKFLERATYNTANAVIVTNESYKKIAQQRGKVPKDRLFVVRNGPTGTWLNNTFARPELKKGHQFLASYVGVMGPQDGVDYLLYAADHLVNKRGRKDILFALLGSGDAMSELKRLARELKLNENIEFVGWVDDDRLIREYLTTADICLSPEPSNPLNEVSTFIKIMEYMAAGKPIVAFDLPETRFSAMEAALYAKCNDPSDFADKIDSLLNDPGLRARMAKTARGRFPSLTWSQSKEVLLSAYVFVVSSLEGTPKIKEIPVPAEESKISNRDK